MSTFADRLKAAITSAGIEQQDLAARMNLAASTVSNWCQGTRVPDLEKIKLAATVLNVDPAELAFGSSARIREQGATYQPRAPQKELPGLLSMLGLAIESGTVTGEELHAMTSLLKKVIKGGSYALNRSRTAAGGDA